MALTTTLIDDGAAGIASAVKYLSLHTADPGAVGSNESTAARVAVTPTHSGGVVSIGSTDFTGGAASGACTYAGLWDAPTSGTFLGGIALSGDQTFNAAGEYTVSSVTITGSQS